MLFKQDSLKENHYGILNFLYNTATFLFLHSYLIWNAY